MSRCSRARRRAARLAATAAQARQHPQVIGAAPFIAAQALMARGDDMRGALVRGISPDDEASVTDLAAQLAGHRAARLVPGAWGIVLGGELARSLGVREGDKVTLIAPGGQVTPAGVVPRLKQLTVVGTFDAGHYEYDSRPGADAPRRRGEAVPRRRARPACSCA